MPGDSVSVGWVVVIGRGAVGGCRPARAPEDDESAHEDRPADDEYRRLQAQEPHLARKCRRVKPTRHDADPDPGGNGDKGQPPVCVAESFRHAGHSDRAAGRGQTQKGRASSPALRVQPARAQSENRKSAGSKSAATATGAGAGFATSAGTSANTGSMPNSTCDMMRQQMLWATSLHRTSLVMATSVRDRIESPSLALHMEKTLSELDRWW